MKNKMRYIISVGIDKYNVSCFNLLGCVNDSNNIFKNMFGETIKFHNKNATKKNIINKLKEIIKIASENDEIIFFFAGHGTQLKDYNSDENDLLDEAIFTHNISENITDDELHQILKFKNPNTKVILIFDGCHMGTIIDKPIQNVIYITSCKDNEYANEIFVNNQHRGLFSYAIENAIKKHKDWESIYKHAYKYVKINSNNTQNPQFKKFNQNKESSKKMNDFIKIDQAIQTLKNEIELLKKESTIDKLKKAVNKNKTEKEQVWSKKRSLTYSGNIKYCGVNVPGVWVTHAGQHCVTDQNGNFSMTINNPCSTGCTYVSLCESDALSANYFDVRCGYPTQWSYGDPFYYYDEQCTNQVTIPNDNTSDIITEMSYNYQG